ncbi:hypothetical protein JRO89_XS10G0040200 [Xanthoceras sorbifolium]|uniref:Uncharacterized protein n=1 Tax=Xanthoceras sorbifolium TaxID=99658 RepID=A0ABQ8HHJ3_9ROSI|nr:hypothetical protein JRO89_XS10G0040200 [Xanthoceras sorbifolium]
MDQIDDNVSNDIKSLTASFRGKFEALYPLSSDCCIYRVPKRVRQSNEGLFTSHVVSIGPFHHGKEELEAMEEHKIRYLQQFLERTQTTLEDFRIFIKNKEEKLRNCYAETIPFAIYVNFCEAKHFLDLLRRCVEPTDHQLDIENELSYYTATPTITELHQAGVKFRVGSSKSLFDVRFDKGTLEIPKLRIENVGFFLYNVRIFEGLHCKTNYMNDYALLLSLLVSSPKDAELLIQNGIIENTESVAASTFCQQFGKNGRIKYKKFYYTGLARDLNAYCKSPWHKWKANLKQNYFNTPWASISVIAAVILLLLTLTQTVFSIIAL